MIQLVSGLKYPDLVDKILNRTFDEVDRYISGSGSEAHPDPVSPEPKRISVCGDNLAVRRGLLTYLQWKIYAWLDR